MTRILIADDHPVFRAGVRQILSADSSLTIIGEASSADELTTLLDSVAVDVLLLDISMPGTPFHTLLRTLTTHHPEVRVLVLSMHPEDQFAVRALRDGAAGYLTKERSPEELIEAIKKVASGGKFVTPTLAEQLAEAVRSGVPPAPHDTLSDREHEILSLLGAGKTVRQIAADLRLSPKTVSTYRTRILRKMSLQTSADLIRYAVQHGLTA